MFGFYTWAPDYIWIKVIISILKFNEGKDMVFGFDENSRDSYTCMERRECRKFKNEREMKLEGDKTHQNS